MTKPIILAPAGGFAAVTAAVRCGADAVYLGAKNFNARRNAENFDDRQGHGRHYQRIDAKA